MEVNISSKDLLDTAKSLGLKIKSHLSNIEEEDVIKLKEKFMKNQVNQSIKKEDKKNKKEVQNKKNNPVIIRREVIIEEENKSKIKKDKKIIIHLFKEIKKETIILFIEIK